MKFTDTILGQNKWRTAATAWLLCLIVVGVFTVGDYGMTWDEHFRFQGGDAKLDYYKKLLAGESTPPAGGSYPGLFDLPLAWAHELFPEWGTRSQKGHIWSLCFGLLGLLATWRAVAQVGGERAGFWALLLLTAMPRYYGHMFFNPKDIPLAATYALGLWALVVFFSRLPLVSWSHVAGIGVVAGLAMATRIAGFLILCYFGLFALVYVAYRYSQCLRAGGSLHQFAWWKDLKIWAGRGLLSGMIAFAILFIFWPTLHQNPLEGAAASVEDVQSFGWSGMVLMDGRFWEAQDLPFYYIPYWLFRSVPDIILILLLAGLILSVLECIRRIQTKEGADPASSQKLLPVAILAFGFLFPVGYLIGTDPTLYDGMRHFLFVLPPLVCLAALSLEWIIRQAQATDRPFLPIAIQCGVILAVGLVLAQMVSLHPYQYVYFNQLSGGLPAAYNRDETDYWGLSHKEAAEWLNDYAEQVDPGGKKIYKVHLRYSRWMLKEDLDELRFELTPERAGADFFVSITRFNLHASYPDAEVLHVVERQGVPLCFVFKLPDAN